MAQCINIQINRCMSAINLEYHLPSKSSENRNRNTGQTNLNYCQVNNTHVENCNITDVRALFNMGCSKKNNMRGFPSENYHSNMSDEERRNFDISGQEFSHNNFERQSFSKYSTDDGEDIAHSRRNGRHYLREAKFLNNRRDRSSIIRSEGRDTSYYCDCESAEEESTHNGSNSRHDGRSYRTDENIRSNWKNLSSRMRLEEPEASYYSNDSAEYEYKSTHNGFNSRRKARFNSRNGRRHNISKIDVIQRRDNGHLKSPHYVLSRSEQPDYEWATTVQFANTQPKHCKSTFTVQDIPETSFWKKMNDKSSGEHEEFPEDENYHSDKYVMSSRDIYYKDK